MSAFGVVQGEEWDSPDEIDFAMQYHREQEQARREAEWAAVLREPGMPVLPRIIARVAALEASLAEAYDRRSA